MKKIALVAALAVVSFVRPAHSDPITGNLAIAGATTYTSTGMQFSNPSVTLIATGNFLPLIGHTEMLNSFNFGTAAGATLFATVSPALSMNLESLTVISNTANFLNVVGTAMFLEPGFDPTLYEFTLTATRPDGVSSYTLTAVPEAAVVTSEPLTLFLVGSGLLCLAGVKLYRRQRLGEAA